MSNKPQWSQSPYWANWIAYDGDIGQSAGRWVWFEQKPVFRKDLVWCSNEGEWLNTEHLGDGHANAGNSLQGRP